MRHTTKHKARKMDGAIQKALDVLSGGQVDGDHHKAWVIDQAVRALTGRRYEKWVAEHCNGEDGPDTYSWEVGVAP